MKFLIIFIFALFSLQLHADDNPLDLTDVTNEDLSNGREELPPVENSDNGAYEPNEQKMQDFDAGNNSGALILEDD